MNYTLGIELFMVGPRGFEPRTFAPASLGREGRTGAQAPHPAKLDDGPRGEGPILVLLH